MAAITYHSKTEYPQYPADIPLNLFKGFTYPIKYNIKISSIYQDEPLPSSILVIVVCYYMFLLIESWLAVSFNDILLWILWFDYIIYPLRRECISKLILEIKMIITITAIRLITSHLHTNQPLFSTTSSPPTTTCPPTPTPTPQNSTQITSGTYHRKCLWGISTKLSTSPQFHRRVSIPSIFLTDFNKLTTVTSCTFQINP